LIGVAAYPDAADYLRAHNLDPAIATQLGADHAHVVGPGIVNDIYATSFIPFIYPMALQALSRVSGGALSAYATGGCPYTLHHAMNFCQIVLPSAAPIDPVRTVRIMSDYTLFAAD